MSDTVSKTRLIRKTARLETARVDAHPQPQRLGNYTLTTRLGSGGMGSVYRAHDDKLDRIVAVKVMLAKLDGQPDKLNAFRREAQAAAKLNHPNIAHIYSFGEDDGRPYIVMEYVSGDHFDQLIQREEPLDQAMVMKIGMDIAAGLAVAADASLIHGDIKPENIVFDDHGIPKLLDFGIASASNDKTTEVWGTPYYIAPEKLKKQRIDFRSDIYCLGGTLYHAITKRPPFNGDDVKEIVKARLVKPPVPISVYRPDVDPEVEAIILRMLQPEPADRYPTYGALLNDIRKYLRRVRPQMVPVTTEMLFVTTQFIAEASQVKTTDESPHTPPEAVTQETPPPKQEKKHLFSDLRSQLLLLLTLVAFFPYFVMFYSGVDIFAAKEPKMPSNVSNAAKAEHSNADSAVPNAESQQAPLAEEAAEQPAESRLSTIAEPPAVRRGLPSSVVESASQPENAVAEAQPPAPQQERVAAAGATAIETAAQSQTAAEPERQVPAEPPVRQQAEVNPTVQPVAPAPIAELRQEPPEEVVQLRPQPIPAPSQNAKLATSDKAKVAATVAHSAIKRSTAITAKPPALPPPSASSSAKSGDIVELPPVYDGFRRNWPELKVTATMGSEKGGSALVNGDVITVGYTMQSGVKLIAIGPHYAEFDLGGEIRRIVVTAAPKKSQMANNKKGRKK